MDQRIKFGAAFASTFGLIALLGVGAYAFAQIQPEHGSDVTIAPAAPKLAANEDPTVSISAQVSDLTVTFDASAAVDPDGQVLIYVWDFGDGTLGTQVTTSHTYAAAGTYTVVVNVTDDRGGTARATTSVTVTEPPPPPPAPRGDPGKCPPWTTVNSNDGVNDTSCIPNVCLGLTIPDPAHPECDYFYPPSYYW